MLTRRFYVTISATSILTNFLEFRLYREGVRIDSVLLARPLVLNQLCGVPPTEKPTELLDRFLDFLPPAAFSAAALAVAGGCCERHPHRAVRPGVRRRCDDGFRRRWPWGSAR